MRNIVTGKIDFYLGWRIKKGRSIKAPNLLLRNGTLGPEFTIDESRIAKESSDEIKKMMRNINKPITEQKA